ncbi:MAG: glycosyltransferase family 1 protein [Proteobacteria bacterium]|nr:glycosyltransferase family 1 protein [Pseudomonadota bacterium]
MILCNTKTLNAPLTGVQRYVQEILRHAPANAITTIRPGTWCKGPLGHFWEQAALPLRALGKTLFSPANTGPLLVSKQMVTLHDLATFDTPEDFSANFRAYYTWLLPKLLPRVAHVITVSEFTRQCAIDRFGLNPGKITAIPLGVNHQHFYPRSAAEIATTRQNYGIAAPYVLALSSLSPRKNLPRLLQAWQQALPQLPANLELLLAGGAGAANVLKSTNLAQLPARTRLLGRIEDAQLPALLSGAEAFVFPSLYEGFGLPPLEAMACGAPCLVTNAASVPEVVGAAALTFSPHNVAEMAEMLVKIATQPALARQLKAQGLAQAQAFQWQKTANKTLEILRNI